MNNKYINGIRINWDNLEEDHYVRKIKALHNLTFLPIHKNITFFVGENGSGKSTLLEAIAVASGLNAEGEHVILTFPQWKRILNCIKRLQP